MASISEGFPFGCANFNIALIGKVSRSDFQGTHYQFFETVHPPDLTITLQYGNLPDLTNWQLVFVSGNVWQLHRNHEQWAFSQFSPVFAEGRYQTLVVDLKLTHGTLFTLPSHNQTSACLTVNSLLSKFMVFLLAQRRHGLMLHACAISDHGIGRLFCGISGAGKSTLARLWQNQPGVEVLSDDRVILIHQDGQFWIYGTPWPGDAGAASPRGAPLEQVFILEHAPQHTAIPLSPRQCASEVLVRSFPPFWDPAGMDFTLGLLSTLAQSVPCYRLGFRPQPDVLDYVRCLQPSTNAL